MTSVAVSSACKADVVLSAAPVHDAKIYIGDPRSMNARATHELRAPTSSVPNWPSADDPSALLGNYHGISSKQVTPLKGLERHVTAARVRYALGAPNSASTPALVPSQFLSPGSGAERGVLAEYFDNPELRGEPKLRRAERRPYFEMGMTIPPWSRRCSGGSPTRQASRSRPGQPFVAVREQMRLDLVDRLQRHAHDDHQAGAAELKRHAECLGDH